MPVPESISLMKLRITFDFAETDLQALAAHYGVSRIDRANVRLWVEATVEATLQVAVSDYEHEGKDGSRCQAGRGEPWK